MRDWNLRHSCVGRRGRWCAEGRACGGTAMLLGLPAVLRRVRMQPGAPRGAGASGWLAAPGPGWAKESGRARLQEVVRRLQSHHQLARRAADGGERLLVPLIIEERIGGGGATAWDRGVLVRAMHGGTAGAGSLFVAHAGGACRCATALPGPGGVARRTLSARISVTGCSRKRFCSLAQN